VLTPIFVIYLSMTKLEEAIDTLVDALKEGGKEPGSYYYSWQANIAMSMYDEFQCKTYDVLPEEYGCLFNRGAQRFLDMLISTTEYQKTLQIKTNLSK